MPFFVAHRADGRACAARHAAALLLSSLILATLPAAGLLAQTVQPMHPVAQESSDPFAAHVAEASLRFGIPPGWIRAVRHVESRGDPHALSPKGAMGLMQVMPETWAALRARHALGSEPFDPRDNILTGAAYLREMHDRYGDVTGMLAAYNAGPGRYDEHLVSGRALPAETRAYVAALAPMLGGETLSGAGFAAAPPRDWREAPLFIGSLDVAPVQSGGTPAALEAQAAEPSDDASAARPSQSNGLFVRRFDAGAVQ